MTTTERILLITADRDYFSITNLNLDTAHGFAQMTGPMM